MIRDESLFAHHVPAHAGHAGNELADLLAKHVREQPWNQRCPAINLARWMHGEPPLIEWAWTMSDFDHRFGMVPTFYQQHLHWRHWTPPSTSLQWLPQVPQHHMQEKASELHLKFATYNVSSIKETAAATFLRSQLQYYNIHVAGLQETRAKYDDVPDSDFYRFISIADKGQGGCELWVNRTLPLACYKGDPCYAKREHFQVLCAKPHMMIVTANIAHVAFTYCVAHAPHSGASSQQRDNWWKELQHELGKAHPGRQLVIFIDANTQLPHEEPHTGKVDAQEDDNSTHLLDCMRRFSLCTIDL